MIPEPLYREILRVLPIICVDAIARRPDGRFLLVRRCNEPLKGDWWVVGGRILQGEKAVDAVLRKLKEEVGLTALSPPRFVGMYEDLFDRNAFEAMPYHTLSLVYEVQVEDSGISLDEQSDAFRWNDTLPSRFEVLSSIPREYLRKPDHA